MIQLTADAFKARTELDPNWCSKITEPIEVIEYLNMDGSNIQSLSPLLTFSGKGQGKDIIDFSSTKCTSTKVAQGFYPKAHDYISPKPPETKKPKELGILPKIWEKLNPQKHGTTPEEEETKEYCASFFDCKNLKKIRGTFIRNVQASKSLIDELREHDAAQVQNKQIERQATKVVAKILRREPTLEM